LLVHPPLLCSLTLLPSPVLLVPSLLPLHPLLPLLLRLRRCQCLCLRLPRLCLRLLHPR
jgi:hypothetical protein